MLTVACEQVVVQELSCRLGDGAHGTLSKRKSLGLQLYSADGWVKGGGDLCEMPLPARSPGICCLQAENVPALYASYAFDPTYSW